MTVDQRPERRTLTPKDLIQCQLSRTTKVERSVGSEIERILSEHAEELELTETFWCSRPDFCLSDPLITYKYDPVRKKGFHLGWLKDGSDQRDFSSKDYINEWDTILKEMDKEKKRQDAVKEDRKRRELLQRLTTVISIPAYPNPVPNEFGLMDYNPDAAEMALRRLRHFRGDKESWKDTSLINALPMTEDEWLRLYQKAEKEGSLPRTLSK